jgi:hypothetical protein
MSTNSIDAPNRKIFGGDKRCQIGFVGSGYRKDEGLLEAFNCVLR